ncbi:MAG TPA: DinB family protein [Gemmatimonadaceae bacterium]|nr:DinB family protein [Gemmatimonadaceae bacterium]
MPNDLLKKMVDQNRMTSAYSFDRITDDNASTRLTPSAASIGFIFRHIAETINLFCQFLGVPTDVQNTTIGRTDEGQGTDIQQSRRLVEEGFAKLYTLVETRPDDYWGGDIETPFFGTIPRIRLFAHTLFHNSHHAGQIALTLSRGSKPESGDPKQ